MASSGNISDGAKNPGSRKKLPFRRRNHPSTSIVEENREDEENREIVVSTNSDDPLLNSNVVVGYIEEENEKGYSFSCNIKGTKLMGVGFKEWPPLSGGKPIPAPKPRARRASKEKVEQKASPKGK